MAQNLTGSGSAGWGLGGGAEEDGGRHVVTSRRQLLVVRISY